MHVVSGVRNYHHDQKISTDVELCVNKVLFVNVFPERVFGGGGVLDNIPPQHPGDCAIEE